jgi:hypothetical protein
MLRDVEGSNWVSKELRFEGSAGSNGTPIPASQSRDDAKRAGASSACRWPLTRGHNKPYAKIANAKQMADAVDGVTHIVKYHDEFDDDASLVLTETDFLDRLSFDSPLDIKFRADALGRTILFIGYSMSDPNIRLLLHGIWRTWERSGHRDHRPRSFVFMPSSNPVQEAMLARWGITLLTPEIGECADGALTAFLADIQAGIRPS